MPQTDCGMSPDQGRPQQEQRNGRSLPGPIDATAHLVNGPAQRHEQQACSQEIFGTPVDFIGEPHGQCRNRQHREGDGQDGPKTTEGVRDGSHHATASEGPRRAASMVAMSIFPIVIMAMKARLAA